MLPPVSGGLHCGGLTYPLIQTTLVLPLFGGGLHCGNVFARIVIQHLWGAPVDKDGLHCGAYMSWVSLLRRECSRGSTAGLHCGEDHAMETKAGALVLPPLQRAPGGQGHCLLRALGRGMVTSLPPTVALSEPLRGR